MSWIVVNVGCIECRVSTNIVGVFTEKSQAEAVAEKLDDVMRGREGGQNSFEVFPMPANANAPTEEYAEALVEVLVNPLADAGDSKPATD